MKIAVMQPYLFPYIGYFQLINLVDKFIFYDDVSFIKGGWINRNRLLINNEAVYFTIPLQGASSFRLIRDITIVDNRKKILKTIELSYRKASYFQEVFPIIKKVFEQESEHISDIAISSITEVTRYLSLKTEFEVSHKVYSETVGQKAERLFAICRQNNCKHYINSYGGHLIYDQQEFKRENIKLEFLKTNEIIYKQFGEDFVPNLSIIDVLMHNSKTEVVNMLSKFCLA